MSKRGTSNRSVAARLAVGQLSLSDCQSKRKKSNSSNSNGANIKCVDLTTSGGGIAGLAAGANSCSNMQCASDTCMADETGESHNRLSGTY